ncbi:MAG TPA: DUF1805 domain-containing protein [Opitutaceae bacterium]|nr:DUF1805 domain-containing protein [Opitutaceae bacterium]
MKNIIATFHAKPGQGAALETILREQVRLTAQEPGALVYELWRDEARPETYAVVERYRDAAAKAAHLATPYLAETLRRAGPLLAGAPALQHLETRACLRHEQATVEGRSAEIVVMPLGPVSLVYVRTERGLLACGAIDPAALEKFGIAAARVKPATGGSIGGVDDLLAGEVREANGPAQALGIHPGMTGRAALARL